MKLSSKIDLPPEIAGKRTAVFGLSGSGKSNTATVLVEGLLSQGEQVVLIDPKGEAWGLRSLTSGKPSNLDLIIFGEPHGDVKTLDESHGKLLADFVVDSGRSIALSLLALHSKQAERRFVAQFCEQLYRRKTRAENKTRTLVVFEEAHRFMPENAGGDQAQLLGAVQDVVLQGRSFGLGALIVDQRPQNVSKSVVSQCDTLICHQLIHPRDRKALDEWVSSYDIDGRGEGFLKSLALMQPGEAWVWSPVWLKIYERTQIVRRKTFDSGAAPDNSVATKVQRAGIDLEQLKGQLADIVEKAKADDPKELRKRIAELERQIKGPTVDQLARTQELLERDAVWQERVNERDGLIKQLRASLSQITSIAKDAISLDVAPVPQAAKLTAPVVWAPTPAPRQPAPVKSSNSKLGKCERSILQVLSQFPDGCEAGKLTLLAGYTYSGSFQTSLSALRTAGLISGANNSVMQITDAGLDHGPFEPLPTGQALVNYWLGHRLLGKCERFILQSLIENPDGLTKDELCTGDPYTYSGSFQTSLSKLRTAGLIEGRNNETMTAAATLLNH